MSQAGAPSDPHHSYSSHFCPRISFTASGTGVSFSANFLFQMKAVEHEENVTESKNMKGHGLRARLPAPPRWVGQGPQAGAFGGVGRDSAQCHTPSSADSDLTLIYSAIFCGSLSPTPRNIYASQLRSPKLPPGTSWSRSTDLRQSPHAMLSLTSMPGLVPLLPPDSGYSRNS